MKGRYFLFFWIGVMTVGTPWVFISCQSLRDYPSDNFIEEYLEDIIEQQTGEEIDLSPFSSEDK